jgi:hypothetical protein
MLIILCYTRGPIPSSSCQNIHSQYSLPPHEALQCCSAASWIHHHRTSNWVGGDVEAAMGVHRRWPPLWSVEMSVGGLRDMLVKWFFVKRNTSIPTFSHISISPHFFVEIKFRGNWAWKLPAVPYGVWYTMPTPLNSVTLGLTVWP